MSITILNLMIYFNNVIFSGKNKLSTFPIQIILSISKNNSMLYLIQKEPVDRFSSVNPPKHKFTNN